MNFCGRGSCFGPFSCGNQSSPCVGRVFVYTGARVVAMCVCCCCSGCLERSLMANNQNWEKRIVDWVKNWKYLLFWTRVHHMARESCLTTNQPVWKHLLPYFVFEKKRLSTESAWVYALCLSHNWCRAVWSDPYLYFWFVSSPFFCWCCCCWQWKIGWSKESEGQDKGTSAAKNGQDWHRLSEASRCILQVSISTNSLNINCVSGIVLGPPFFLLLSLY